MAKIYSDITELIGGTPLVRLSRFAPGLGVLAKLERQNPAGSAKDRVALSMPVSYTHLDVYKRQSWA